MVQMLQFVSCHLPRQQGCYFRVFVHPADAPEIPHLPETFAWTRGLFYFLAFPHTTSCRCSGFAWDIYLDRGCFFSGFPHTTLSRCSSFCWDLYMDMRVIFFGGFHTLHHPVAPVLLGTFIQTQGLFYFIFSAHCIIQLLRFCSGHLSRQRGCFFSGFPHIASSSCSSFAWEIYLDTRVVSFGFSAHYIIQLLRFFSANLSGHRGCFFLGFPHTASSSCSGFAREIYPDTEVVFLDRKAHV